MKFSIGNNVYVLAYGKIGSAIITDTDFGFSGERMYQVRLQPPPSTKHSELMLPDWKKIGSGWVEEWVIFRSLDEAVKALFLRRLAGPWPPWPQKGSKRPSVI